MSEHPSNHAEEQIEVRGLEWWWIGSWGKNLWFLFF
jgi:heme/copper-type cytochrome/quinol oxidase subunit 2